MSDSGSATRPPVNVTHLCPRTLLLLPGSGPVPSLPELGHKQVGVAAAGVPTPVPARLTHLPSFRTRSPTMSTVPPASEGPTYSPAAPAPGPTTSAAWTRPSGQHPRACGYAPGASRRYGRAAVLPGWVSPSQPSLCTMSAPEAVPPVLPGWSVRGWAETGRAEEG